MPETPLHEMRSLPWMPARLERLLNSAVTRGPGYEPTPVGPHIDVDGVRGYYIDYRAKTDAPASADLDRLPAIPLIQLALGWWDRGLGEPATEGPFLELCEIIARRGVAEGGEVRWPMHVTVSKHRLRSGWSSALSQGQAASVFVRAHLATRDDRYADLAAAAIEPLLGDSELVVHVDGGPVLEEAPSQPASHVLNGWMSALWGVRDVHLVLGLERAQARFDESLRCLQAMLPAYDTGWWSRYALYPHTLQDLAKPIYHRFHVAQLEVFHRLTGIEQFGETAARWAAYDRPSAERRAVLQKAAFVATDAPRRLAWTRRLDGGS